MRGLSSLGLRVLTEHRARAALTAGGVALGVALFVGALVGTVTSNRGLDRLLEEVTGQADVVANPAGGALSSLLEPDQGTLPADQVGELAALDAVEAATGVFGFPTVFESDHGATEQLVNRNSPAALVGAELAAQDVYLVDVGEGTLPRPGAAELVLPPALADQLGIEVGDEVLTATPGGRRTLRVSGVLTDRGVGRLQTVGFTSLEAAWDLAGETGVVSQIALTLREGVAVDDWVAAHRGDVPPGVDLVAPSTAFEQFSSQIATISGSLVVLAAGLLFSGGFLIYLTLSMAVVERTRLYGVLQALGATRRQVRRLVVAEALVLGGVATAAGIGLGILVAIGLNAASQRLLSLFGSPPMQVPAWVIGAAVVVGLGTTVVSALLPAKRASSLDPVAAIRGEHGAARDRLWPTVAGSLSLVAGGALMLVGGGLDTIAVGLLLLLVGAVQVTPLLLRPVAALVRPVTARLSRGAGDVAVLHLVKERTRSAYTLALVMVVMSLALAAGSAYASFLQSLDRELREQFGEDLELTAASSFTAQFVEAVSQQPGVEAVTAVRQGSTRLLLPEEDGERVNLTAVDPATYFGVADFAWVDGDVQSVADALDAGGSLILPAATSERLGIGRGDTVELATAEGSRGFTVAGVAHMSNIPTRLVIGVADADRLFGMDSPSGIGVALHPGAHPATVAARIENDLGSMATFIVSTPEDLRADVRAQFTAGISGFFVMLLLAGIVGLFGLANTLAVSMMQRSREIGLLRAIGARRSQVRGMAIVESATLVAAAFVLAVPLGAFISQPLQTTVVHSLGDLSLDYAFSWQTLPVLALGGFIIGIAAAVWPARRAAAMEIDTALRFE